MSFHKHFLKYQFIEKYLVRCIKYFLNVILIYLLTVPENYYLFFFLTSRKNDYFPFNLLATLCKLSFFSFCSATI